jgi:hypothetical protein
MLCLFESRRLQLSPQDIAMAEACGITFLPATAAQVQRLAMQRKIFYAAGQPILATRGDGFYETVGTLQRLIEDGLQQRDLAAWQRAEAPPPTPEPPMPGPAMAEEANSLEASSLPAVEPSAVDADIAEEATVHAVGKADRVVPPKRERRSRHMAVAVDPWPAPAGQKPSVAEPVSLPVEGADRSGGDATARPPQAGQRWLVAGAARRGRAGKHWSNRQR